VEEGGMTFYAILGVPPDADGETIRVAYRALARQYHPDAGEGSSPEKFRELADAYETLSDPQRRRTYDLELGRSRPYNVPIEPLSPVEPLRSTRHEYIVDADLLNRSVSLNSYLDAVLREFLDSLDDDAFLFGSRRRW
jgi:curved DNA-binding protein CbpA